jgi:hypothetical protein
MDIAAVAALGRYYANRIRSVTHLALYYKSEDHSELTRAHQYLVLAVSDWDRLSDVTEEHFGYVPEYIRMGVKEFRWRDEGRGLGADLEQLDNLEDQFRKMAKSDAYHVVLGHTPPVKGTPGKALSLSVSYVTQTGNPKVTLFYRNSRQAGYSKLLLKLDNEAERKWSSEVPAQDVVPGYLEYYFEAVAEPWGPYGGTLVNRPPYRVLINDNDVKPIISSTEPHVRAGEKQLAVTAKVECKSKIASVRAYYKPMPAGDEWASIDMQLGAGGDYSGNLPMTREGILYYFEAVDIDGNGVNYPDFLQQTPYFAVKGWAPAN